MLKHVYACKHILDKLRCAQFWCQFNIWFFYTFDHRCTRWPLTACRTWWHVNFDLWLSSRLSDSCSASGCQKGSTHRANPINLGRDCWHKSWVWITLGAPVDKISLVISFGMRQSNGRFTSINLPERLIRAIIAVGGRTVVAWRPDGPTHRSLIAVTSHGPPTRHLTHTPTPTPRTNLAGEVSNQAQCTAWLTTQLARKKPNKIQQQRNTQSGCLRLMLFYLCVMMSMMMTYDDIPVSLCLDLWLVRPSRSPLDMPSTGG